MKRILCYGDSNTWGTESDGSFKHCKLIEAYPSILQTILGSSYCVISEGMPSRTTCCDDISLVKGNRNGKEFFVQCLISHQPIDYVVLFLGTNDLKTKFNKTAVDVANSLKKDYILFTKNVLSKEKEISKVPQFIVVCPPVIKANAIDDYDELSSKKSLDFDKEISKVVQKCGCGYVSNEKLVVGEDGIHLMKASHNYLAKKLAKIIRGKNEL